LSYTVEPLDVTGSVKKERVVDPRAKKSDNTASRFKWWLAQDDKTLVEQLLSTTEYLKRTNQMRIRQASVFTRLFSGKPLYNFLASNATLDNSNQLPIGRPTANVVYSCSDTLVSLLSQDEPMPTFLTDGGHYKQRRLSKDANQFVFGEFKRTKLYDKRRLQLRDACVIGNGLLKVFPRNNKIAVERTLSTELLSDFNDAYYGEPMELIQLKLVDRGTFQELFPDKADMIESAQRGDVDSTPRSKETVADQFIIAEGWHLRSGEGATDGRHSIVCSAGMIEDEQYDKDFYPFANFGYNPNVVGYFSQSLAEILMPTQMEIYRMLIIASQAIELEGIPRWVISSASKIMSTSINNRLGSIITTMDGSPPVPLNREANAPEIYQWIQWLIQNAYQMSGINSMAAQAKKTPGLNSGEAIREANDLQSARFTAMEKRFNSCIPDLAHLYIDCATDIVKETGKYTTLYPGKDGIREVDFKSIGLLKDSYVIQCFEESSLPKDPAGRQAKLSEMLAAGEITPQEFRRLSNFPDLKQSDQLASALEERILYCLDDILENGRKNWDDIIPDEFMLDPSDMASTLCINYINLYKPLQLEEEKIDTLRDWLKQVAVVKAQAAPPPVPTQAPQVAPNGQPLQVQPPQPSIGPASNAQV
jgi:hypothetical protein